MYLKSKAMSKYHRSRLLTNYMEIYNFFIMILIKLKLSTIILCQFHVYLAMNLSLLCNNVFDTTEIVEQDVIDAISVLQVNKAVGPDFVSHKMLKETIFSVTTHLCFLFNRSLKESLFPTQWKISNVLPLFKKGDSSELSNYRPVSLLSCVGKIMERVVFKCL